MYVCQIYIKKKTSGKYKDKPLPALFILIGCYDGGVYTLSRATGETIWIYKTKSAVKSSPAVDPRTGWIYIGSHDHHFYSLDIQVQIVYVGVS